MAVAWLCGDITIIGEWRRTALDDGSEPVWAAIAAKPELADGDNALSWHRLFRGDDEMVLDEGEDGSPPKFVIGSLAGVNIAISN